MIFHDDHTRLFDAPIYDAYFGCGLPYIFGAVHAVHRLIDARAEISAVNEAMKLWQWVVPIVYVRPKDGV